MCLNVSLMAPLVPPLTPQASPMLYGEDGVDIIIFIVHLKAICHWVCPVIDLTKKRLIYYDSLSASVIGG